MLALLGTLAVRLGLVVGEYLLREGIATVEAVSRGKRLTVRVEGVETDASGTVTKTIEREQTTGSPT